jgi:hypothetical protein
MRANPELRGREDVRHEQFAELPTIVEQALKMAEYRWKARQNQFNYWLIAGQSKRAGVR